MTKKTGEKEFQEIRQPSLPIVGGLILFSVLLGTTSLGFIPVPTEARHATTMHLPTIVASLLEGWPAGMVVGTVFGITSMYTSGSPMAQDPIVAMIPRMVVGLTPYFVYKWMLGSNPYVRLGAAAIAGSLTNTILFLGFSVARGFMGTSAAINIALVHGIPESFVAVIIVIPSYYLLRRLRQGLDNLQR